MRISNNTILITGGASGIGFALTEELLRRGSKIKICDINKAHLEHVRELYPEVEVTYCDITDKKQRIELFEWATSDGGLNVLINNAGAQRNWVYTEDHSEDYDSEGNEIDLNLTAPVHLCELFIPYLVNKQDAVIVNVSSFLAIVPIMLMPVYCGSKSGLHMYTRCIREQLADSGVKVFEALPPAVDSGLNPKRRAIVKPKNLVPPAVYAASLIEALEADVYEIYSPLMAELENMNSKELYEYFKDPANPR